MEHPPRPTRIEVAHLADSEELTDSDKEILVGRYYDPAADPAAVEEIIAVVQADMLRYRHPEDNT